MAVADIGRRRHAHAADQAGGQVGEDVAEHVLRHHDVEIPGPLDQHRRAGIDIEPVGLDLGMPFGGLIEHPAKERKRLEHIGLVDAGQAAIGAPARLAAFGKPERKLEQPLRGLAGDDQRLARLAVGDDALAHRGEQAFGGFPDHDEIDAALIGADDRARHARDQPRRPHAGIEIEMKAQLDLRHDLGIVGIAHRRQAAGAEQDRVGLVAQPHRTVRHRLAGRGIIVGAGGRIGEAEFQIGGRLDLAQDFERRRHHFGADAVAAEHGDVEGVVRGHGDSLNGECHSGRVIASDAKQSMRNCANEHGLHSGLVLGHAGMTNRPYGVSTARPTSLPFCRSTSASLAFASGIVVTGIGGIFLHGPDRAVPAFPADCRHSCPGW